MDIDMDIDFEAGAPSAAQPVQVNESNASDAPLPAAYYENLDARPNEQWPDYLNLQGVDGFDPQDAVYYLIQVGCQQRLKNQRWVNDTSVNLQFYSAEDAALALQALTDPEAGDAGSIPAETARKARRYESKPNLALIVRQANSGDQKVRNAGDRSHYYKNNPDARGADRRGDRNREREPRRRAPPRRDFLDYGDEEPAGGRRRSASGDEQMRDGSDYDNRRNRRNGNRERDGRLRVRPADLDSYRPGSKSPRESRFGRLRGRSASPVSGDEGDGRYGFTEEGTSTRTRYRSRSRSRNDRRRREPSGERWTHDRHNFSERETGRWSKDTSAQRYGDAFSNMSNHRRSDAFDETNNRKGSLLSRMTKDGQPIAPQGRSLASRITRDSDDSSFGRLKDDDSAPQYTDFSEPAPKRGLAGRITRDEDDDIQIRGRGEQLEGINIRGTASQGGFSIRGVAGGA
ncbi:hypothetical protein N0V90_008114 [Kalmusia sp. IMI 367209]|nr:hypothetical protein N0V90_008114 [Kalmusia sp. IMI 367209]